MEALGDNQEDANARQKERETKCDCDVVRGKGAEKGAEKGEFLLNAISVETPTAAGDSKPLQKCRSVFSPCAFQRRNSYAGNSL